MTFTKRTEDTLPEHCSFLHTYTKNSTKKNTHDNSYTPARTSREELHRISKLPHGHNHTNAPLLHIPFHVNLVTNTGIFIPCHSYHNINFAPLICIA